MASDPRVLRDRITRLPLLHGVADALLARHVLVGEELRLAAGETLVEQGERSLGFDILLDGVVEFARDVGGRRVHVLTFEPPSCWGHEPLMADVPVPVSGLALADSWIYRLPPERFWEMVSACPGILRGLVRTVAERFQVMGENTEHQMRLVSLGTMTAGLAHELNNPASAARAAAAALGDATLRQARASVQLAGLDLPAATRAALAEVVERGLTADRPELDALARADRADELTLWLERRGIADADEVSAALTDAGVGLEDLGLLDTVQEAGRPAVAAWLAWTAACAGLAAQVGDATGRLGDLVAAMRTYSRLDEAAEQDVDLQRGLEDTLRILAPRLRAGITVQREYADGVPTVVGSPGALNQVWTHLIENAAEAMEGRGVLRVATARQGDRAVVSITDDGPGIPADIRERIFEPFFTTKAVGQAVGLGLDIVSRIVQGRHGEVRVRSRPGETRFDVLLPVGPGATDGRADPGPA